MSAQLDFQTIPVLCKINYAAMTFGYKTLENQCLILLTFNQQQVPYLFESSSTGEGYHRIMTTLSPVHNTKLSEVLKHRAWAYKSILLGCPFVSFLEHDRTWSLQTIGVWKKINLFRFCSAEKQYIQFWNDMRVNSYRHE